LLHFSLKIFITLLVICPMIIAETIVQVDNQSAEFDKVEKLTKNIRHADSLKAALLNNGYLDYSINRKGDTLLLDAGQRYLLGNITVAGKTTDTIKCDCAFSQTILNITLYQEYIQGYTL